MEFFTVVTGCELLTGIKLMNGAEAEAAGKYTNNKDARKRKDGIDEVWSERKSMSSWKVGDFKLMGDDMLFYSVKQVSDKLSDAVDQLENMEVNGKNGSEGTLCERSDGLWCKTDEASVDMEVN